MAWSSGSTLTLAQILLFLLVITLVSQPSAGHGHLAEPPGRASAWRYNFQAPPDYDHNQLYCGGITQQHSKNGGRCGVCGDDWSLPPPRPHELGGHWGKGLIVRSYEVGADIPLSVYLTASHKGYFEFRVCPDPAGNQTCLDRHLLSPVSDKPNVPRSTDRPTRFYPREGSQVAYNMHAKLPKDLRCDHCLLQWRYYASNNNNNCLDQDNDCGQQEEFRGCADIMISDNKTIATTPRAPTTTTYDVGADTADDGTWYLVLIIGLATLLAVVIVLGIVYLYKHHGQRIKQLLWA